MVSDRARTDAIFAGLRRVLKPDTVFCELGCGTGIFSIYAASICRRVYAVEMDPQMMEIACRNFQLSEAAERIESISDNALDVELPEQVDVLFCEMMSIWTIEEPQVRVCNSARKRLLKPDGLMLPSRIVNQAELGHYDFERGGIQMKAATPLFTGIRRPAVMTERRTGRVLDFDDVVSEDLSTEIEFEAAASGDINCAVLTSLVQFGSQIVFSGSDSLMPPTVVPLDEDISVRFGDRIRFQAAARANSDFGESAFVAEVR